MLHVADIPVTGIDEQALRSTRVADFWRSQNIQILELVAYQREYFQFTLLSVKEVLTCLRVLRYSRVP